jgi:hypothetical protein
MTAEQIERLLQDNYDSVNDEFMTYVERSQEEALAFLLAAFNRLKYDGQEVSDDQENFALIAALILQLSSFMSRSSYADGLRYLSDKMKEQFRLTRDYFKAIDANISPQQLESITAQENSLLRSSIDSLTKIDASFYDTIRNALTLSVVGRSTRDTLEASIREIVVGNASRKARLYVFANTLSDTLFASVGRAITMSLSRFAGFSKFRYAGGLIKDSRDFCIARDGNVYDENTIRSWASIPTWQGKIPNTTATSIFYYLGGYRCRHWLVPIKK